MKQTIDRSPHNRKLTLLFGSLLVSLPATSYATGDLEEEPGFGGYFAAGASFSRQQSQFDTDSKNKITKDLNNAGKRHNDVSTSLMFETTYTFRNQKTQLFLGQSGENIIRGQQQLELGIAQMVGDRSQLELAYFPRVPGYSESWKDPYLTGKARSKTDHDSSGFRLAWHNILDSPVTLRYGFVKSDISDEQSGKAYGLSLSDQRLMRRDGKYHRVGAEMLLYDYNNSTITPQLYYTQADTDGEALSYDSYGFAIESTYSFGERHSTSINIGYSQRKYDSSNPIFNKTQKDKELELNTTYSYSEPFSLANTAAYMIASYDKSDSNITFYDSKELGFQLGLVYEF